MDFTRVPQAALDTRI